MQTIPMGFLQDSLLFSYLPLQIFKAVAARARKAHLGFHGECVMSNLCSTPQHCSRRATPLSCTSTTSHCFCFLIDPISVFYDIALAWTKMINNAIIISTVGSLVALSYFCLIPKLRLEFLKFLDERIEKMMDERIEKLLDERLGRIESMLEAITSFMNNPTVRPFTRVSVTRVPIARYPSMTIRRHT